MGNDCAPLGFISGDGRRNFRAVKKKVNLAKSLVGIHLSAYKANLPLQLLVA
jgi:hypothetical protein